MEVPENCNVCPYTNNCTSWYGWDKCRYLEAINEKRRKEHDKN